MESHHPGRGSGRRGTTVALLVLSLGLSACSSPSAGKSPGSARSSGTPVTEPSVAQRAVAPMMAKNNRANTALNSKLLAEYESGTAFAIDNAMYRADRVAKKQSGFLPAYSPFTIKERLSALQRQVSWPDEFLVEGPSVSLAKKAPKGPSCDVLLDLEKTAAAASWQIVLEPSTSARRLPPLALNDGYAQAVSPKVARAADSLPSKIVTALMTEEKTGDLGPFTKADFSGECWQLPDPRLDVVNAESAGYGARDLYRPVAPADTSIFALRGGKTLVLFTLRFTDELVAAASASPVRWSHPSVRKNPAEVWTYLLAAGKYGQVKENGYLQLAVELSAGLRRYSVIGSYEGVTAVSGTKVKKKSGTSTPGGTLEAAPVPVG